MKIFIIINLLAGLVLLQGCSSNSSSTEDSTDNEDNNSGGNEAAIDIKNAIFTERSGDCADYTNQYEAAVVDITRSLGFNEEVLITADDSSCSLLSNTIPNHDFNDATAQFATDVSQVSRSFTIPRNPALAASASELTQPRYDGVMLNGVPIDILSAGCYDPTSPMADADGNVAIGCEASDGWLIDPLGSDSKFGADMHNAHTQPDGSYHYHGSPEAMFDDSPGGNGSPVIGFAADGFPIYGSYFFDADSGAVRKVVSGYTLKNGQRPSSVSDPGGEYDGIYVDDWEFTDAGDLDVCNGMTVDGQYGYYVTDSYPWIIKCLSGTPDDSFMR